MGKKLTYEQLLDRVEILDKESCELKKLKEEITDLKSQLEERNSLVLSLASHFPNSYISIIRKDYSIGRTFGGEFEKLNLDPNAFVGLSVDTVFGENADFIKKKYAKTFKGDICEFELFINEQHQLYKTFPIRYEDGKVNKILVIVENVTKKKEAQIALKKSVKSEKELADIMRYSPLPIVVSTSNGDIIKCNSALPDLLGCTMRELLYHKKNRKDITPEKWWKHAESQLQKINRLKSVVTYRKELIHNTGKHIPVEITMKGNFNKQGKLVNYISFIKDITDNINAEKEIQENQEALNLILDNIPFAIYVHDLKGDIVRVNRVTEKDSGYSKEELLNLNIIDLDPKVKSANEFKRVFEKLLKNETHEFYTQHLRKNGTKYPVQVNLSGIRIHGKKHIVGIAQNIEGRLKLQNNITEQNDKLQFITTILTKAEKMAKLGGWQVNLKTQNSYWTDEVYAIHDTNRKEHTPNLKNGVEFYTNESIPILTKALQNAMEKGDTFNEKLQIISKKGVLKDVWVLGYVKNDDNGNPESIYGTIQDISEQTKLESELRTAKEKAEESNRLKSAFLANISHEIRTPLNAILGFSNLLSKEGLTADQRQLYSEQVTQGNKRLLAIIDSILELSKIESNQIKVVWASCNLNNLLDNLMPVFDHYEFKSNTKIVLKKGLETKKANFYLDEKKLAQVFTNLIENALKFTKDGKVEVGYSLNADKLHFYVKDNGRGIHPDYHKDIFNRFTQIDIDYSKSITGTGLGLAIVKNLIEMHNGEIWVESALGKGATFHFTIPCFKKEPKTA